MLVPGDIVSDILGGIGNAIISAILAFVQAIVRGALWLELYITQDLVLKTPAIGPRWIQSPYVIEIPAIGGPAGIVHQFYARSFNLVLLGTGLGLFLSGFMLLLGFLPKWRAAAIDNLLRTPVFLVLALLGPWLLQFLIDANTLLVGIAFPSPDSYVTLRNGLWNNLLDGGNPGDQFGQLVGLLVAVVAMLLVVLELAMRYGVILLIGSISPLVLMGLAFNFTRGFALKALRLFTGAVFLQGFAAIALRLMLEVVVAYGSGGGIASWALLSGMAAVIAYLPKILSGASEAVGEGARAMRTAAGALVGTAAIGGALAAKGAAGAAAGRLEKRLANKPPSSQRLGRAMTRAATFSRSVADNGYKPARDWGGRMLTATAYSATGVPHPRGGQSHDDGDSPGRGGQLGRGRQSTPRRPVWRKVAPGTPKVSRPSSPARPPPSASAIPDPPPRKGPPPAMAPKARGLEQAEPLASKTQEAGPPKSELGEKDDPR